MAAISSEFAEQVKYELELAELREGLVRFNDAQGRPVLTLLDGTRIADARRRRPVAQGE